MGMRPRILVFATAAALGATAGRGTAARVPAGGSPYCFPADTMNEGESLVSEVREMATSSDSATVVLRNSIHLAATDSAQVSLVTDETKCQQDVEALNAYAASVGGTGTWSTVYLVKVGEQFAVYAPDSTPGAPTTIVITDSLFHWVGAAVKP